jgi:class 3 adenylate cyclase
MLSKLWKSISAWGVVDQSNQEKRRITVLNRTLFLGVIVSFGYVVLYIAIDSWSAALINTVFISLYSSAMLANYFHYQRLARHIALLSANAHMFALSTLVLGEASGVHRWYWMFIVVTFLVFTREEKRAIYFYAALSIALFTLLEHGNIRFGADPVISQKVASIISVTSTIATLTLITIIVDLFDRETGRAEGALEKEHERSESLLLNVLPRSIATRLKEHSKEPIADSYREVTVLFADLAGFTVMSKTLDPQHIVTLLNDIFSQFDNLAEKYKLEKIKTIGDAYMVAGGLPDKREDHADAVALMALEMAKFIQSYQTPTKTKVEIRIGINTGPVVAGVIGVKKFIYDLWGDTVNTASRMESHGVVGSIQVTEDTYQLLKNRFAFEPRGSIEVKGKGPMKTYLLLHQIVS